MQLLHNIHRAEQSAAALWADKSESDLTVRQVVVMAAVAEAPGASQTALVTMTGIDRSTLADMIKRLCSRGLARRRRTKEDARAYAVVLTEHGMDALARAQRAVPQIEAQLLKDMPALKGLAKG